MKIEEIYRKINELINENKEFAVATVISKDGSAPRDEGSKMIVLPDKTIYGSIGGGTLEAVIKTHAVRCLEEGVNKKFFIELEPEKIGMYCKGSVEVFIEVYKKQFRVVILGGGHVGKALSDVLGAAGIYNEVVDDRPEYSNKERFPSASRTHTMSYIDAFKKLKIDENTFIVIVTRCHETDFECLGYALKTPAPYIGVIGSESKKEEVKRMLNEWDERIHMPVGLPVGNKEPGEIAVSIAAEILLVKNKLKEKNYVHRQ